MPGFPSPSSGGFAERAPGGSAKPSMPGKAAYGGQSGGQVMISGPEEKALRVLELDNPDDPNDDTQLLQQASLESGMPIDRVQKLKARAEAARNKGMTLKGPTITLQPINPQVEDGLLGTDPMTDVGGQVPGAPDMAAPGQGQPSPMGAAGPAAGRPPQGGSIASGATMSSAGLSTQRFAPSWRPAMSQATMAPPRMTPDDAARATSPGRPPTPGVPSGAPQRGGGLQRIGAKPSYQPASAPRPPQRPLSNGQAGFGRADARDPRLAAAYAREAKRDIEECSDCGGTCRGKKARRPHR